MKVKAKFVYVCGSKGTSKAGKDYYRVSLKVTEPDEIWDVFTNKEVFEQLQSMFEYDGVFEAKKWSNNVQIGSLLSLQ